MKKIFVVALCAAMALSLVACGGEEAEEESSQSGTVQAEEKASESSEPIVPAGTSETVNPYVDCQTLEEAQELAGLTWTVPEEIGGSTERQFRAVEKEMLEVIYRNGENETARIRKAPGSDDISGRDEEFSLVQTVDVDGSQVTMKGDDGLFTVAIWSDDANSCSVVLEQGVTQEELSSLVSTLQEQETV